MASHPARPPLGLFDNPVRVFSPDELAATVRKLERERPGRTVEELSGAVFTELAIERTRRAADLVAEAIRLARPRQPGLIDVTGNLIRWTADLDTAQLRPLRLDDQDPPPAIRYRSAPPEQGVASWSSADRSSGRSGTGGSAAAQRLTATCAAAVTAPAKTCGYMS